MRLTPLIVVTALFGASSALAADPAHPAVIELFQSQGCSSCPPATANLNALAGRPDLLPLNFSVTYWDQLGWKDTFASPAYTARQWDYAHAGGRPNVATPQMIVNGRAVLNGGNRAEIEMVLRQADRGAAGPSVGVSAGKVVIGAGRTAHPATVWLVRYDPRIQNVAIAAGENGGRTLPHKNIVRDLRALGTWRGQEAAFALPSAPLGPLRQAVLVQEDKAGPIIAAARL